MRCHENFIIKKNVFWAGKFPHLLFSFHFLPKLMRLCSTFFCRILQRASSLLMDTPTPLQPAFCSQSPASSIRLNRTLLPSRTPRRSCQKHKTLSFTTAQNIYTFVYNNIKSLYEKSILNLMLILTGPLVSLLMLPISVLCIVMTKLKLKQCKYNDVEFYHYQMSLHLYIKFKKMSFVTRATAEVNV